MEFGYVVIILVYSAHIEGAIILSICRRFLYVEWGKNGSATSIDNRGHLISERL